MPRKTWSKKEERQYQHVKESGKKRGQSERRASNMAARVVNKQRTQKGTTKKQAGKTSSSRRSESKTAKLQQQTKRDLYKKARELDIDGRSRMNKSQLVKAIQKHR